MDDKILPLERNPASIEWEFADETKYGYNFMNKIIVAVLLTLLSTNAIAAQQPVTTITPGTGATGLNLKQYNDTYINPRLTNIASNDTDLYTNKADKSSFSSSSAFTATWGWTPGVSNYNDLTNKPVAGTDFLAPNGSAANLTNFPSTLATDAEVSSAVSGKEASLGNPATNGWCLQSTTGGTRSWGVCGSGSFDPTIDATITGDWTFSSGLEASNVSINLGTLADLKIGNAQMVDDTKGNGDTNYLWSADKTYDQLATKQATLVSGTNIKTVNGSSLLGTGDLTVSGSGGLSPSYVTTNPTTASAAGLYINTVSGHMFVVGTSGMIDIAGTWTPSTATCSGDFGNLTQGSTDYFMTANTIELTRIPACAGGTLASVKMWLTSINPTDRQVIAAVYADNNGEPGARIWNSEPSSIDQSGTAQVTFSSTASTSGSYIWVGLMAENSVTSRNYNTTGGTTRQLAVAGFGTSYLPSTWDTANDTADTISPSYSIGY